MLRSFLLEEAMLLIYIDKSVEKGKSRKLKSIWIVPAIFMNALTPHAYRVKLKNKDLKGVNHDSLKICSDHELPSWIAGEQTFHNCLCGLPDDGDLMIRLLHICFEWYHSKCVNLIPTNAERF